MAPATHELYVFRTSNLLSNPVAMSCDLEAKIPLTKTELTDDATLDMTLQTIKGGLLVDAQTATMTGELTFYNVTQFTHNRLETHPLWRQSESTLVRKAGPASTDQTMMLRRQRRISEASVGTQGSLVLVQS